MENHAQAQEPPQGPAKISQTNVTWKGNGKSVFQSAFEAWGKDKPKNTGAGDFILDLIQRASRAETAIETNTRLEALGIRDLVEMHQRRAQADARMLEQIADIVEDARLKAAEAVKVEMEALKASKTSLESSLQSITGEFEKSRRELETVKSVLENVTKERDGSGSECEQLRAELEKLKGQLAQATVANEKMSSELEREKLASIALKEKTVAHDRELNTMQKKADEAEIAYKDQVHNLERQKAEIEAAHRQEILQMDALKQKELTDQMHAQFKLNTELENAKNELQHLQDKMEENRQALEDGKKASMELALAKITIARLEGTVAGQKESLANLAKAIDVMKGFKPVQTPEMPPRQKTIKVTAETK